MNGHDLNQLDAPSSVANTLNDARYRTLTETLQQIVWIADLQGRVTFCNAYWYRYTGVSEQETIGFNFADILHPDERELVLLAWQSAWRDGHIYDVEHRLRDQHGAYQWFRTRATPVIDAQGQRVEWLGTAEHLYLPKTLCKEITDRDAQIISLTESLAQRNRELDQFAYVTSHDLKAPLRGISHLSQWIEEDLGEYATDEVHVNMELLRGRVQRMEGLIDGILQYSRAGRMVGPIIPVNVQQLLEDVIDDLDTSTAQISIGAGMPQLQTDRLMLGLIFTHLIDNAVKHSAPGVQVTIASRDLGNEIEFAVADTGPGIAAQYHERIFAIFQTLVPRDRVEGSGLGLALIRKILDTYHARIWLDSAEGKGSTFYFTWPKQLRRGT